MSNPIAVGLGGVAGVGATGLVVATAGTAEMTIQYLGHRDEILEAYAEGMTRRNELYGDGAKVTAEDISQNETMAIDTFRHAYSSGYLKMHYGETIASSFDLWEIAGPVVHAPVNAFNVASSGGDMEAITQALLNPRPSGSQMDYWNNATIRHEDVTPETLIPIILEKMRTNELALDPNDPRLEQYEGPGLPPAILAKNIVYEKEQKPEDYFGFVDRQGMPAVGEAHEDLTACIQWAYEQLLEEDSSLVLHGDARLDVETLHAAAAGDEAMQRYLQHVDYQLASHEAITGVQNVKPVVGSTPDIPSMLQEDDALLNPSSARTTVSFAIGK